MAWKSRSKQKSISDPAAGDEATQQACIHQYFLYLLSRREYSRSELWQKAVQKQFNSELAGLVLDELEDKEWLNDTRFARAYATHKTRILGWGPRKVYQGLMQKGVNPPTAQSIIASLQSVSDPVETMLQQIKKQKNRLKRESDPLKRQKKVVDYLIRKGFEQDDIFRNLKFFVKMIDE